MDGWGAAEGSFLLPLWDHGLRGPPLHSLHLRFNRQAKGSSAYYRRVSGECRDDDWQNLRPQSKNEQYRHVVYVSKIPGRSFSEHYVRSDYTSLISLPSLRTVMCTLALRIADGSLATLTSCMALWSMERPPSCSKASPHILTPTGIGTLFRDIKLHSSTPRPQQVMHSSNKRALSVRTSYSCYPL